MKAIILAGGNGTRLYPISLTVPKPMTALVDKPLLEHIIILLKKHGITNACMTLRYLPKTVTDYFGDGSRWGLNLECRTEDAPLGTAGGIKACSDFISNDDILVISGDAACNTDLSRIIDFHYSRGAEATIALYKSDNPLEYGLVLTDSGGKVLRFIEKPSRDRIYTDQVNTGIYIISNKLLSEIPENKPFDFARDLFPRLLDKGRGIYGLVIGGYWRDIGNCASYLRANIDALSGALPFDYGEPAYLKGVWSKSRIPPGVVIRPPCYIGENVSIANGAVIGPYSVIGSGSVISSGVRVNSSVIDGAYLGERVSATGAVICGGAKIGNDAHLLEGSVVGSQTVISSGCLVSQNVHVWPDKSVPPGLKLRSSIVSGMPKQTPLFESRGILTGEAGVDVTPELCFSMGTAIQFQNAGIAYTGGEFARILAESFGLGANSAGCNVRHLDCAFPASAAFTARSHMLPITLFAEQRDKRITLWFFNQNGLAIDRDTERKLESAYHNGAHGVQPAQSGGKTSVIGTLELHAAAVAACTRRYNGDKPSVRVEGRSASARLLKTALAIAGYPADNGSGLPLFETSSDGFSLRLTDEDGNTWDHSRLLLALTLSETKQGAKEIALPYHAPYAADALAAKLGGRVYRLYRDGVYADELMISRPYASDAAFLALRLTSSAQFYGGKLCRVLERVPHFFTASRELSTSYDRGRLMRELYGRGINKGAELVSGLKLDMDGGVAFITPAAGNLLRIRAESAREETAEEICANIENTVKKITRRS